MSKLWIACLTAGAIALSMTASEAQAARDLAFVETEDFAEMPAGARYPEGIATDPASGDVYVGTFDFGPNSNKLVRFSRSGRVIAVKDFGPQPLLGLEFAAGKVYILNFGASRLQRIAADFNAATPVEDVAQFPSIGSPGARTEGNPDGSSDLVSFGSNGFPAPNAMVFDALGNAYVSDSFQGAIYRINSVTTCGPCPVTVVSHHPLLATAGHPPFGANGLALSPDQSTLYVANTGDHRVLKMNLAAAVPTVFSQSLHGADGLLWANGRLWVATNQADHVVALDANGKIVISAGEFLGIRNEGTPRGLLFPASLATADGFMYVTNLALPLTPQVGDEPEEEVTRWTISRFRLPK